MKRIIFNLILIVFILPEVWGQSLQPVWQTRRILKVPESVLFLPKTGLIYVSNIDGKPAEKNGKGFISLLDPAGLVVNLHWVTGLNAPKGMAVKGNKLYVSDIDRVAVIQLHTGKILRLISFPGARFLNDVAVGPDGKIYVTDTELGAVFVMKNYKPRLWKKDTLLKGANGLAVEDGWLLIGSRGHLLKADVFKGFLKVLARVPHGIDGLVPLGNGKFVVSDWSGEIRLILPDGTQKVLSNTTAEHINAADLGFIPGKKILLIPTFFDNRVIAKKLIGL